MYLSTFVYAYTYYTYFPFLEMAAIDWEIEGMVPPTHAKEHLYCRKDAGPTNTTEANDWF